MMTVLQIIQQQMILTLTMRLMEPSDGAASKHLSVATVYSDTEEETERTEIDQELIIISSSEDDL